MSAIVNRNREIMQNFIDILNTGDWEKIKSAMVKVLTQDYILHDQTFPRGVKTYA